MRYFPVFLDLEGRKIVVAGGGEAATQKLRLLLKTPAQITVFAEEICDEISGYVDAGRVACLRRLPVPGDISGAALVYSATGEVETDRSVAALARAAGIPVNTVDRPALSDFLTPAIVDRDPVTVAIGTEGTAPVLARTIKARIEGLLPASTGAIARLAGAWRQRLARLVPQARARRRVWQRFFANGIPAFADALGLGAAQIRLEALAMAEAVVGDDAGVVSLIETQTDDPDRLTPIARRRLHEADVIVFDRDTAPRLRELARREAKFVPVDPDAALFRGDDLLLREVAAGQRIVRLFTGGHPGLAEIEMIALGTAGIKYEFASLAPAPEVQTERHGTAARPVQFVFTDGAM